MIMYKRDCQNSYFKNASSDNNNNNNDDIGSVIRQTGNILYKDENQDGCRASSFIMLTECETQPATTSATATILSFQPQRLKLQPSERLAAIATNSNTVGWIEPSKIVALDDQKPLNEPFHFMDGDGQQTDDDDDVVDDGGGEVIDDNDDDHEENQDDDIPAAQDLLIKATRNYDYDDVDDDGGDDEGNDRHHQYCDSDNKNIMQLSKPSSLDLEQRNSSSDPLEPQLSQQKQQQHPQPRQRNSLNKDSSMAIDWMTIRQPKLQNYTSIVDAQSPLTIFNNIGYYPSMNSGDDGGFVSMVWSANNGFPTSTTAAMNFVDSGCLNNSGKLSNQSTMQETADSSYDSDADSENLRRFVQDLVDSGNSTTPDQDDPDCFVKSFADQVSLVNRFEQNSNQEQVAQQLDDGLLSDLITGTAQQLQCPAKPEQEDAKLQLQSRSKINNGKKKKRKSKKSNQQQQPQQQPVSSDHFSGLVARTSSQKSHEEIDRTTSETLSQEYGEYVTHKMITKTSGSIDNNQALESRIEFGKKLGYPEAQIKQALEKLGLACHLNELLAELINITSNLRLRQNDNAPNKSSHNHHNQNYHEPLSCSISSSVLLTNNNNGIGVYGHTAGSYGVGYNSNALPKPIVAKTMSSPVGSTFSPSTSCNYRNTAATSELRAIVIDGSNVAVSHGKQKCFSCRGIEICAQWFKAQGHQKIFIFVPSSRKSPKADFDLPVIDREILLKLEDEGLLYFTPTRNVSGKMIQTYDDRYILKQALKNDAIIVSNDYYRDLTAENPEYKRMVDERLLLYVFVEDEFCPPEDPFGPRGPTLKKFLSKPLVQENSRNNDKYNQICPYGRKCTYGIKCKYQHAERLGQSQQQNNPSSNSLLITANSGTTVTTMITATQPDSMNCSANNKPLGLMKSLPLIQAVPMRANNNSSPSTMKHQKQPLLRTRSTVSMEILDNNRFQPHCLSTQTLQRPRSNETTTKNETNSNISRQQQQQQLPKHRKLVRQLTLDPDADPRLSNLMVQSNSGQPYSMPKERLTQTKSWNQNKPQPQSLLKMEFDVPKSSKSPFTKSNSLSMAGPSAPAPPPFHRGFNSNNTNTSNNNNANDDTAKYSYHFGTPLSDRCSSNGGLCPMSSSSSSSSSNSLFTNGQGPSSWSFNMNDSTNEAKRSNICQLLLQLFSADKVFKAMQMLPNETNSEIICRKILSMDDNNDDYHHLQSNNQNLDDLN